MKRVIISFLIFCVMDSGFAPAQQAAAPADPSLSATLYHRAPDTLPGTLPEMRDPKYWISRLERPDEVILTPERIEAMNRRYEEKMRAADPFREVNPERKAVLVPLTARKKPLERAGRALFIPDVHAMRPEAVADTVREVIRREIAYLRSIPFGNMYAVAYSPREIDALEREMALDGVPNRPEILDGVAVRHARIRIVPSHPDINPGLKENSTIRAWDMWNLGILRIGRPVWALHASRTGAFLFVLSDEGYGWVDSGDIAFGSRAEIVRLTEPKEFAVCTGDRVQYFADARCRIASGVLRMGDRVPLAGKGNPQVILVPLRRNDGSLEIERAWLAEDADVHAGYLPYTRRNIVATAFKLL
ncbi:MAG: SH3 domain-containing protein, partial [Candidatus Latescibacterota bacterium]